MKNPDFSGVFHEKPRKIIRQVFCLLRKDGREMQSQNNIRMQPISVDTKCILILRTEFTSRVHASVTTKPSSLLFRPGASTFAYPLSVVLFKDDAVLFKDDSNKKKHIGRLPSILVLVFLFTCLLAPRDTNAFRRNSV